MLSILLNLSVRKLGCKKYNTLFFAFNRGKTNARFFICFIRTYILGIESSCDDSAAAVISRNGALVGESIITQASSLYGGVIPPFAMNFHAKKIPVAVSKAIFQADLTLKDLRAIAVTTRPGLSGSLSIGTNYAKFLCIKHGIPLIPVHHMEAHALTARMIEPRVKFPFLVLLISGGHCLLAMALDIDEFLLLGKSIDSSPGECLDKAARMLKLHSVHPQCTKLSGGQAVELLGKNCDHLKFKLPIPLLDRRDCDFSFSGLGAVFRSTVEGLSQAEPDHIVKDAGDLCASLEYTIARHLAMRVQRAICFADQESIWYKKEGNILVVSGGVASNRRIRCVLRQVCSALGVEVVFPPIKYCTDNGVMVAWNGLEKYRRGIGMFTNEDDVLDAPILARAPFGFDISQRVSHCRIKCRWVSF